jgi:tetratricopeptide (TPR) repeat protein
MRSEGGALRRLGWLAVVAAAVALVAFAWLETRPAARAERLYRDARYADAYGVLRQLASGVAPAVEYDAGNSLYRLGRFEEALVRFHRAEAAPGRLAHRARYNAATTYARAAEAAGTGVPLILQNQAPRAGDERERVWSRRDGLRLAVAAFEEALLLDPGDVEAKWNLEVALRKLAESDPSGGPGRRRHGHWGRGNLTVAGSEGRPEAAAGAAPGGGFGAPEGEAVKELTESEARRLLSAVEREQRDSEGDPGRRGGPAARRGRDW